MGKITSADVRDKCKKHGTKELVDASKNRLKINLSLKNSTPKSIKYLLNILLKVTNSFCRLDQNLHGIYETINVLNCFN